MGLEILKRQPWLGRLVLPLWLWDAQHKFNRLNSFLPKNAKYLEIGCGLGTVTSYFRQQGLEVTSLDIQNTSLISDVIPIIYQGKQIPFEDNQFDLVLLLTVLHHTENPLHLLEEAKRVGKTIIIIEDIYDNWLQKYLTYTVDSIVNWEFSRHPHNNLRDLAWKQVFTQLNMHLVFTQSYRFLALFKQVIYILQ